jgi:hypothetical protein
MFGETWSKADGIGDRGAITVSVPLKLRRYPGRKVIIGPNGTEGWNPTRPRIDSTLVKLVARAHRWKRLLECGKHTTITDLAAAEKISRSYLCRVLRLSLLAPDIVEAILSGRQPTGLSCQKLLKEFPDAWNEHREVIEKPAP